MAETWFSGGFDMKVAYSGKAAGHGKSKNENKRNGNLKSIEVDKATRAFLADRDISTLLIDL